jgi:MoaA/NifB/PqqE/SkfB family radical SAM enzyme
MARAMKTPIAVFRTDPEFLSSTHIDWNLGTLCNYECSYCPKHLHDGALKWPDPELAVRFCERALGHYRSLGRRTYFKFTGGEPTLFKHLIMLLRRVKELGGRTGVNSNGSRDLAWWDRAIEHLDFAILTHHIEHTDPVHFTAVAKRLLESGMPVHVNVTMLPERFDECAERASALRTACRGISIALKPLLVDFRERMYPYTDGQKQAMQAAGRAGPEDDDPHGAMRCIHADGTSRVAETQDFILRDENHWRSWNCNAGIESLAIRADGEVYRAVCGQQGSLGNLRDPSLSFPTAPIRCAKDSCACLADIKISKWYGEGASPMASGRGGS